MRLLLYVTTHMTHMHLECLGCWSAMLANAPVLRTIKDLVTNAWPPRWDWLVEGVVVHLQDARAQERRGGTKTRGREICKVVGGRLLKLYLELSSLLPSGTHPAVRSRACTMD